MKDSPFNNTIRWIIVFPAGILANAVMYAAAQLFAILFGYYQTDTIIGKLFADIAAAGISGYAFAYIVYRVSPNHKRMSVVAFTAIFVAILGALLYFVNFISGAYYSNLGLV